MDPIELLSRVTGMLWDLADSAARSLANPLAGLQVMAGEADPALQGRLLEPLTEFPDQHALLRFVRELVGDPAVPTALVRAHGWKHAAADPDRGVALVLAEGASRAVLAVSPGPVIDVVVTPGSSINRSHGIPPWQIDVDVETQNGWSATFSRGGAAVAPAGTATVTIRRTGKLVLGTEAGPHVSFEQLVGTLRVAPGVPLDVDVDVQRFAAAVLPPALAEFLGAGRSAATRQTQLLLKASREHGLRFADAGVRVDLPIGLNLPGVSARGFAVELSAGDSGLALTPTLSLFAKPPALPLSADMSGLGARIPLDISGARIGVDPNAAIDAVFPSGMAIDLALGPVSGGGAFLRRGADAYAGVVDIDLGIVAVQAFGLLRLPVGGKPLSLLVLLGAEFPYPGIQLGFGFAIDAVGGLVGINRRVDDERLKALVQGGNSDRILFPGNAVARADEIAGSLEGCFPVAAGRFVVGPMIRLNWGGRMVTLSAAVLLELPNPVRVVLLGRLLIAVPDPVTPLIRLQADVLGRIDPGVPMVDFLISLAGSWIVGIPISGELYVLFRGGADPVFVLSAGGFHPRYTRPAGVPELARLSMDLGGGFLGLRADAYLALTSNSLQFGAELQLDATIAGCGVEGWLGLDALFVWDPTLMFAARIHAGVAVLAFGRRLASIGLDFTLEGPTPWHAFGTGSISVLFWDVSLDFDVRWGDSPPTPQRRLEDIFGIIAGSVARRDAWAIARPATQRAGLRFTDDAKRELAEGVVAQPDAVLRFNQTVVPLDVEISRFHRFDVPKQTWTVPAIELEPGDPADLSRDIEDRFVPGEYFVLKEHDQLTRPAFEDLRSGFELADTDVVPGAAHVVDDDYETDYKVEPGWFPLDPGVLRLLMSIRRSAFVHEQFARPISAAERVDRWRVAQRSIRNIAPNVVITR